MIRLIEQALRSSVVDLGFVARYGGLVRPVTVYKHEDYFTPARNEIEEGQFVPKTFPVSCYVSAEDCFDGGKYLDLVPDDQYASVAYFEQRGGATVQASGPNRRVWEGTEDVRFVCWLNYPRLGLDDCKGSDRFAWAFMNTVVKSQNFTVDGLTGRLDITRARIVEHDYRDIFGRYSYAQDEKKQFAFFWPYDFFALDFTARVTLTGKCVEDVELGEAVECVTTY